MKFVGFIGLAFYSYPEQTSILLRVGVQPMLRIRPLRHCEAVYR